MRFVGGAARVVLRRVEVNFMRFVRSTLLAAGFLVAGTAGAMAWTGVTTAAVNARKGPGTRYAVVSTLPAGAAVNVASCTQNWCATNVGYVSAHYLAQGGNAPVQVVVQPYGGYFYDDYDDYYYGGYGIGYGGGYWGPAWRPGWHGRPPYWHGRPPYWHGRPPHWGGKPPHGKPPHWGGGGRPPHWGSGPQRPVVHRSPGFAGPRFSGPRFSGSGFHGARPVYRPGGGFGGGFRGVGGRRR